MKGKTFADSNVVLYAFGKDSDVRKAVAIELLAAKPCISTQVLNEVFNVLYRKFAFSHNLDIGSIQIPDFQLASFTGRPAGN
jgi:predicted nucleic acid-binding protein